MKFTAFAIIFEDKQNKILDICEATDPPEGEPTGEPITLAIFDTKEGAEKFLFDKQDENKDYFEKRYSVREVTIEIVQPLFDQENLDGAVP